MTIRQQVCQVWEDLETLMLSFNFHSAFFYNPPNTDIVFTNVLDRNGEPDYNHLAFVYEAQARIIIDAHIETKMQLLEYIPGIIDAMQARSYRENIEMEEALDVINEKVKPALERYRINITDYQDRLKKSLEEGTPF